MWGTNIDHDNNPHLAIVGEKENDVCDKVALWGRKGKEVEEGERQGGGVKIK